MVVCFFEPGTTEASFLCLLRTEICIVIAVQELIPSHIRNGVYMTSPSCLVVRTASCFGAPCSKSDKNMATGSHLNCNRLKVKMYFLRCTVHL